MFDFANYWFENAYSFSVKIWTFVELIL